MTKLTLKSDIEHVKSNLNCYTFVVKQPSLLWKQKPDLELEFSKIFAHTNLRVEAFFQMRYGQFTRDFLNKMYVIFLILYFFSSWWWCRWRWRSGAVVFPKRARWSVLNVNFSLLWVVAAALSIHLLSGWLDSSFQSGGFNTHFEF